MTDRLTLEGLAERSGVPVESLREWQARGLIGRPDAAVFEASDVQRVRFIRRLLRRGVAIDALAEAERAGNFLGRSLDFLPEPTGPVCSIEDAAERIGLDVDALRQLVDAAGITADELSDDDVERFRAFKVILEAGLPEEALLQLLRVYAEGLGHVAEAEARLFHLYVHERFRAHGIANAELVAATETARRRMLPLIEPALLYFHRKGFARAVEDDALLHLQEEVGAVVPGQLRLAVAFVDLSSFTPLSNAMGDTAAAQVLARFSYIVHDAVSRSSGRVAKQIGDAFLLVFSNASSAVTSIMEIEQRAAAEPQFPAVRAGIQWGAVLYRDGEYVGGNVNLAARLAAVADRNQVLVTATVKSEAAAAPGMEFVPLGRRALKGIVEEIEVFGVAAGGREGAAPRLIDPVCGMELQPGAAAARLVLDGEERVFCSASCLQLFVAAPGRYGTRGVDQMSSKSDRTD
jgi:class 3 adenylate cyclase/YHS domain-containing protein